MYVLATKELNDDTIFIRTFHAVYLGDVAIKCNESGKEAKIRVGRRPGL